jgi:hypothetical protein
MVRVRYTGIAQPQKEFEALAPYVEIIRDLRRATRRGSKDEQALTALLHVLDTAAYHFTQEPGFYGPVARQG